MLIEGFKDVSNDSNDPVDPNIYNWMQFVFSSLGPILFGTLWDT